MVATNGHRLAKMQVPIEKSAAPPNDLIVPPKALEQVRRLFPAEEEFEIARGDNHLGFRSPVTSVLHATHRRAVSGLRAGHPA